MKNLNNKHRFIFNFNSFLNSPLTINGDKEKLTSIFEDLGRREYSVEQIIVLAKKMITFREINIKNYEDKILSECMKNLIDYQNLLNDKDVDELKFGIYASPISDDEYDLRILIEPNITKSNSKFFNSFIGILVNKSKDFRNIINNIDIKNIVEDKDGKFGMISKLFNILPPEKKIEMIKELEKQNPSQEDSLKSLLVKKMISLAEEEIKARNKKDKK